jgi:ABC-2 type transport system permease protein
MLRHVAGFEFRYQLKSPVFWVGCALFFLMTYGSVVVDQIQIGSRGNVNVNSPFAILQTLGIMSLFATFVVIAMVANVVLRDDETGFAPILRSTSVTKRDYLLGRFSGAVAAALIVLAMMPLAIAFGSLMPWLDPDKVGPFRPLDYVYAVFAFALPTLLIMSALFFSLATATRSMMWTYVGAVGVLVLYFVMTALLRDPRHDQLVALLDPFGLSALGVVTKYYTATERNSVLPPLTGVLLANRLLWLGIGVAVYAAAHAAFDFTGKPSKRAAKRAEAQRAAAAAVEAAPAVPAAPAARGPLPAPRDDAGTRLQQLWALARQDAKSVIASPAFFVLLFIGLLNGGASMWFSGEWYGSEAFPVTRLLVEALNGAYTIIPVIIAIYYSGELVWRDRDRRMHEIVDATAAPDWAHLVPKIVAIVLVLFTVSVVGVVAGVAVQAFKGYTHFELVNWFTWFVVPTTITAVHLAVLAVVVQVLVPQKFIGWGVMLVYIIANVTLANLGFEHTLYDYGATPPVPLSDMNGTGRFWLGRAWLQAYWSAFAVMLVVAAYALWRRGTTTALRPRLAQARWRLRGAALAWLGGAAAVAAGSGAFIYWNTNVLNEYVPGTEVEARTAKFEKELLKYESTPRPKIVDVRLDVDLYPREARAVTKGVYTMENRTGAPLQEIHLRWDPRLKLQRVGLTGATLAQQWPQYRYAIYRLDRPMQPGERRVLEFTTLLEERGFPNRRPLTRIVENGTFVNNSEIAPSLGMSREGLLTDRAKRRKYGLPPDLRPPKLEDDSARAFSAFAKDSDWVTADLTVTTDADQTPIAPGYVQSDRVHDGRRTVRSVTEAPINLFFSVQSARYAIAKDRWKDVDLAVYYHPDHAYNVKRMLDAMKVSLALFSERFSPYQFRQARIQEFPSYADFAQSFANTIPYSENIGFISKIADPDKIDMVTYVTAHEIAHQWWGHQIVSADQQGATMLVESFAQYSALLVMEKIYGRDQVRKFLKYELDRYLRRRGGEVVEELPLARVENQQYIHYQKGTLVMYWLKEAVGQDVVDRSMQRLLAKYAFKPAPYPNPRDFLAILREEAGPQHEALIADLFEKITLYDVRAKDPNVTKRADGKYEVAFTVEGRKFYADGTGKESDAPLDEPFEVGVFTAKPGDKDFDAKSVLVMERRPVKTGPQKITLVVDREPKWVGVDPYNKRIDRNSDDNLVAAGS